MKEFFNPENYVKKDGKIEKLRQENNGEMSEEITEIMLKDRGISFNDRNKPVIDANKFVRYVMTLVNARENQSGIWFYNYKAKHYDLLSVEQYKKIFFHVIEQASETILKPAMEKQYLTYFRNKVPQFQTDGNKAGVLQFNNYILDFSGDEIAVMNPSPEYFCNFRLPYDYDENAECPEFEKFLYDIFEDDEERVQLIQEIMGACLMYEHFSYGHRTLIL